ncbi:hypothetical protein BRD00_04870 [Halobacteriales archaeon QS_8_69_26]|nr:MAG: hypothetical protein BRD00_04870 [Halobacteriales archaeon QS_8_69_26]
MDPVAVIVVAFWAMLPAYVPNNVAVLAGGGRPIDGGRTWRGDRLLGDGKTWRGTATGTLAGAALAVALNAVRPSLSPLFGAELVGFSAPVVLAMPFGAMVGDTTASFLKRRTGRERGAPFPGVDQLDFVVFALLLSALAAPSWFGSTFLDPVWVLVAVLLVTPALHVLTNAIAYVLGLKDEPY